MLSAVSTPKTKITASIIATILLVGSMLLLIIWPTYTRMKELHVAILDQRLELDNIYRQGRSLRIALEQYQEVKPKISVLKSVYVLPGEELKIITTLEELADTHNVRQDIKTSMPTDKNKTLPLQLQATGNFNSIINYLTALEAMDFYLNTTTLRVSLASSNLGEGLNGNSQITALLVTNAFYHP